MNFGAFVQFLRQEGWSILELASHRVNRVEDVIKEGDTIPVKFLGLDEHGRVKLSRKQALNNNSQKQS